MKTRQLAVAAAWMAVSGALYGAGAPVTIVVFDQAGIPDSTFREAVETARFIFHSAGVDADWRLCRVSMDPDEHCRLPQAGSYLSAIVIPDRKGMLPGDESMGVALVLKGERADLCFALSEAAQAFANRTGASLSVVLGCILAHEIGHLLGLKHSPTGIMKAKFESREIALAIEGRLLFDAWDAKALRASRR